MIPRREDGKRDRQLMKRDLTPTQLTTAAAELGAKVNAQPRIIIMRTHGGLDVLFMALKSFPKELHIVEPCWQALGRWLMRPVQIFQCARTVCWSEPQKCKKHSLHGDWTTILERLVERNTIPNPGRKESSYWHRKTCCALGLRVVFAFPLIWSLLCSSKISLITSYTNVHKSEEDNLINNPSGPANPSLQRGWTERGRLPRSKIGLPTTPKTLHLQMISMTCPF